MAIKWLCTGKSEHGYQYKNANGDITNSSVIAVDFKAEIDTESEAGAVNELFDTKPVLTESGVEAFIGLQVYPQGFTVFADVRLTNQPATGVIAIGSQTLDVLSVLTITVGSTLELIGGDEGGGGGNA